MCSDGFGQRQVSGQQKRGPVDAVLPGDLLAHDVEVGRPVSFELLLPGGVVAAVADRGHVVRESVEPDIDDVFLFCLGGGGLRDGYSPGEAGAGDGEVAEVARDIGVAEL